MTRLKRLKKEIKDWVVKCRTTNKIQLHFKSSLIEPEHLKDTPAHHFMFVLYMDTGCRESDTIGITRFVLAPDGGTMDRRFNLMDAYNIGPIVEVINKYCKKARFIHSWEVYEDDKD